MQTALMEHFHEHPPVQNVNDLHRRAMTTGQHIADSVAGVMGSWSFILIQSLLLGLWIVLNLMAWLRHWDPYPFILLNLVLGFQAAYSAPIIMMSQNRQAAKDRLAAEQDYQVNLKAEDEIKQIMRHLEEQDKLLLTLQSQVIEHLLRVRPTDEGA